MKLLLILIVGALVALTMIVCSPAWEQAFPNKNSHFYFKKVKIKQMLGSPKSYREIVGIQKIPITP